MKPLFRGYIHEAAYYIAFGACCMLISVSHGARVLTANIIYSVTLMALYGISAFYHRPLWGYRGYAIMRRIDHAAIFALIAGSATPICLLGLKGVLGDRLLLIIWVLAILGMLQTIFFDRAPEGLRVGLYIAAGWFSIPYLPELAAALGMTNLFLLVAGGVIYTVGGCVYACKRPRFFPTIFGYHEIFHLLVVIASGFHFWVIYRLTLP